MKIIEKANLPQDEVKVAAISCKAQKLVKSLERNGMKLIKFKEASNLLYGLRSHADIHMLHLGGEILWISQEQHTYKSILEEKGFKVSFLPNALGEKYPDDVPLNAAILCKNVIVNPKSICKAIDFTGFNIIPVKQGYTKCSVCIVKDNAIITDDVGIYDSARNNSIDSLLISKGDIVLDGMNYGFIGGCCGLIDKDLILFNGKLTSHRDADKVKAFLLNHHVNYISFGDYPLTDIGGILPLIQK